MHISEQKKIMSIRPLIYVPERDVKGFANKAKLPIVSNACKADGNTKREEIKKIVRRLNTEYDHFEDRTFNAIKRSYLEGWNTYENGLSQRGKK